MVFLSSSRPQPGPAAVSSTGTPSASERTEESTVIPWRFASSMRLRHTMTLSWSSITCCTSTRLRSRQTLSQTTTTHSAPPFMTKSAATSSSCERLKREYVPGRSTSTYPLPSYSYLPSAVATVLPGQLPVCWCMPVKALKVVLFPVLGLPASAMMWSSGFILLPLSCVAAVSFFFPAFAPAQLLHPLANPTAYPPFCKIFPCCYAVAPHI